MRFIAEKLSAKINSWCYRSVHDNQLNLGWSSTKSKVDEERKKNLQKKIFSFVILFLGDFPFNSICVFGFEIRTDHFIFGCDCWNSLSIEFLRCFTILSYSSHLRHCSRLIFKPTFDIINQSNRSHQVSVNGLKTSTLFHF